LPRFLTRRAIATQRFMKWSARVLPVLRGVERVSRSRWHTPPGTIKRAVGLPLLLLVASGIWPLPLINVVPAITIALLAIALLQDDGLLLAVSFVARSGSPLVFGFLVRESAGALGISWAAGCTCRGVDPEHAARVFRSQNEPSSFPCASVRLDCDSRVTEFAQR
jgi:hypothetical protein